MIWPSLLGFLIRKETILIALVVATHVGAYYYGTVTEAADNKAALTEAVQKVQKEMNEEAVRQSTIAKNFLREKEERLAAAGKTIRILTNDLKNFNTDLCPTIPDDIVQHINTLRGQASTPRDPSTAVSGTKPSPL